jgi:murein DD-endopeptidase MepM/ murein hydrolase activator NlpD
MNIILTYTQLMLLTLLALLGSGCTRGMDEAPLEFEEKSTRHTENMTPEEWESFKNKAIESIIRKYNGESRLTQGQVQVVDLSESPSNSTIVSDNVLSSGTEHHEPHSSSSHLHIPEKLTPSTLPAKESPPKKSKEKTFEKVDRYSQLKIKPEETKGKQYKIPPNAVTQAATVAKPNLQSASTSYMWPVEGTICKPYGKSDTGVNNGINIKAKAGSSIVAIELGKVIFIGSIKGLGKVILIEHPNQMIAAYAQVSGISVRANDTVKKGQKIATVLALEGQNGELHFELRKGTQTLNPMDYLK